MSLWRRGEVFEENEHTGSGRDKIYNGEDDSRNRFNCKQLLFYYFILLANNI